MLTIQALSSIYCWCHFPPLLNKELYSALYIIRLIGVNDVLEDGYQVALSVTKNMITIKKKAIKA
ncbi:hypothetical protein EGS88_00025 [Escherichia coli]|nr:hypothetical protein EGS88_00025 [Escherichia coli]